MTSIVVNDTTYFLRDMADPDGRHLIIDGIRTTVNPKEPLEIMSLVPRERWWPHLRLAMCCRLLAAEAEGWTG